MTDRSTRAPRRMGVGRPAARSASDVFRAFVTANRRFCLRHTPAHFRQSNVCSMYTKVASLLFAQPSVSRVIDVGAGKRWRFPVGYKERFGLYVIGVDIDPTEMAANDALDERRASDVCRSIPVAPGSIDLITAYSVVEHLEDSEKFLRQCFAALRPGGLWVGQFPSRYAPFAILNRYLPQPVARYLLRTLRPGSQGAVGFRAYYDRTSYSAFVRMARSAGFDVDYYLPGFFSSGYFAFFVPVYVVATLLDLVRFAIGAKNLASYNLFVLRKPGQANEIMYG